jgi:hypothetical protein
MTDMIDPEIRAVRVYWEPATKEYAFQLWAYVCHRNAGEVARILREENRLPREMPHQRVQEYVAHWAKKNDWRLRIKHDFKIIAPDLHDQMAQEIILGARTSIVHLVKVVNGEEKPDGNRIRAAMALLDRCGFTPIRAKDPIVFEPEPQKAEEASDYALTPEDIYELQARAGVAAMADDADGFEEDEDDDQDLD